MPRDAGASLTNNLQRHQPRREDYQHISTKPQVSGPGMGWPTAPNGLTRNALSGWSVGTPRRRSRSALSS